MIIPNFILSKLIYNKNIIRSNMAINLFQKNYFFQSIKNNTIKTLIQLHIQDYVTAYQLDVTKLEQDSLAKYGKGNEKRKKLIEANLEKINNPLKSEYDKFILEQINQILEFIVDAKNNKLATLLLVTYFTNKQDIEAFIFHNFFYRPDIAKAYQDIAAQMELFSFTYLSKAKIINSLIIVLYTLLVDYGKCDKHDSIKFIDLVINSLFDKYDLPSKIRADYIEKYQFYCAGIYNQLPIFQFYTGAKEAYYNDEDVMKIQSFLKNFVFKAEDVQEFKHLKEFQQQIDKVKQIIENKSLVYELLNNFHKNYAIKPYSMMQYNRDQNIFHPFKLIIKNPLISLKALIKIILTKLYTKLTR